MNVFLSIIIGLTLAVSAVIFIGLIKGAVVSFLRKSVSKPVANNPESTDIHKFNCRVSIETTDTDANGQTGDTFKLDICGTISARDDCPETTAKIFVSDITDGLYRASSVHGATDEWHLKNTPIFCRKVDLGRLPNKETILPDWMSITEIPSDTLILPRKGKRLLQFRTSIFSQNTSEEIAYGAYEIVYDNPEAGYLDIEDDIYNANIMGVKLALIFASSAGKKVNHGALNFIKKWANGNLDTDHEPGKFKMMIMRFCAESVGHFGIIQRTRAVNICKKINEIAPLDVKCNILMLCMSAISYCRKISSRQIKMLKNAAKHLDIRTERLRAMIEDIRPFAMYEVQDLEICLGITSDMDDKQVREQLSSEYRKWNSRVINTNAEIRDEAENMLVLIGETKEELCV